MQKRLRKITYFLTNNQLFFGDSSKIVAPVHPFSDFRVRPPLSYRMLSNRDDNKVTALKARPALGYKPTVVVDSGCNRIQKTALPILVVASCHATTTATC